MSRSGGILVVDDEPANVRLLGRLLEAEGYAVRVATSGEDALSQIGQYQIVTMNRGSNHGLEPGHVLDILQANRMASDPYSYSRVKLPDTYAGKLIVFKVTPRVSFGLVMSITKPVHQFDKVEKPVPGRR